MEKLFKYLVENEELHGKQFVLDNLMKLEMINHYADHFSITIDDVREAYINFENI